MSVVADAPDACTHDVQSAWDRVLAGDAGHSFAIFALTSDTKKLSVVAQGGGPGLRSAHIAVSAVLTHGKPCWGCFSAQGETEGTHRAFGFQVIPPETPALVHDSVRVVKPLLMRTVKQAIEWLEVETADCFSEEFVTKKFSLNSGAENPTTYNFGGELPAEEEQKIRDCVENHFLSVESELAERLANQQKADALAKEEAERRKTEALQEAQKKALAGLGDEIKSSSVKDRIERVHEAAIRAEVDAAVVREQEERVLENRLQDFKLQEERKENQAKVREMEDSEQERRVAEGSTTPAKLSTEQQQALHVVSAAVIEHHNQLNAKAA